MRAPRAKPHERVKAARRVLSPDEAWAAKIREAVLGDCHPFQVESLLDLSRFQTLLVGRGGGKTTTIRADAIISLTSIRRGRLVYIAPTRPMAEELLWAPLKDSIEFYGLLEEFVFNETKLTCTCKRTGAVLKLLGVDDASEVNKLRGRPFDRVYVDEASLYPAKLLEELLDRAIGPRLGERNGRIVMAGTPGHILRGPFYDATAPGRADEDGNPLHRPWPERDKPEFADWDSWSSHRWDLESVANLPRAAELYPALVALWTEALKVKKRKRWSDNNPIWLREYKGIWSADDTGNVFQYRAFLDDGKPWNAWDPSGEVKLEGIQLLRAAIAKLGEMGLKELQFVYAGDMGSTAPFALNVFAFAAADPLQQIFHVYYFERSKMYPRVIAELILGPGLDADNPEGILAETGWPDAWVMDADGATIDELKNTHSLPFEKANRTPHYKYGAIQVVNGNLFDGRFKALAGSPLEAQLESLQWAEDRFGRVQEDPRQANHSTDTAIYGCKAIAHLFDSGAVQADPAPRDVREPDRPATGPRAGISTPAPDEDRGYERGGNHDDGTSLLGESYETGYADVWGNG